MTTIRQLIQTSPTKANELFAKLVDSSTTAVKTRERLFAELKNELGLLASLEEQHLFPVLKKHRETKKLAIEAQSDNRQARRLLADLERTPKGSEDFAAKVSDLRKAFQQHVRDEKNELLPAILKALSDEETEAVVEKIEDKKAEVQAIRRLETEERRAETRRERDVVEAAEQTAESAANVVRAGAVGAREMAYTGQHAFQNGVGTAFDVAQRSMSQFTELFGLAGQQTAKRRGEGTTSSDAMTDTTTGLARGFENASREWLEMSQKCVQTNLAGFEAMARCRSLQDFVAVQSSLIRDNFDLAVKNSRRFAEMSVAVANNATQTNDQHSAKGTDRRRRTG